jgi:hypothetical protein
MEARGQQTRERARTAIALRHRAVALDTSAIRRGVQVNRRAHRTREVTAVR